MKLLTALTRTTEDGKTEVLSPGVGIWSSQPEDHDFLGPRSKIGNLRCQTQKFTLQLPPDASGQVVSPNSRDRFAPVEHGELLFILEPINDLQKKQTKTKTTSKPGDQVPEGCHAVTSPTDGVFYARPAPDAEPFVKVGDTIHLGHTIGLVEVMKTFNPILYGGPDLPDEVKVVELRAEDGKEIRAGELLLVIK